MTKIKKYYDTKDRLVAKCDLYITNIHSLQFCKSRLISSGSRPELVRKAIVFNGEIEFLQYSTSSSKYNIHFKRKIVDRTESEKTAIRWVGDIVDNIPKKTFNKLSISIDTQVK